LYPLQTVTYSGLPAQASYRLHVIQTVYAVRMSTMIAVRPDDATRLALAELTADGTRVSEAVRNAIIEAGARHAKARLRAEVAALASDPADIAASAQVLRDMESLDAW